MAKFWAINEEIMYYHCSNHHSNHDGYYDGYHDGYYDGYYDGYHDQPCLPSYTMAEKRRFTTQMIARNMLKKFFVSLFLSVILIITVTI